MAYFWLYGAPRNRQPPTGAEAQPSQGLASFGQTWALEGLLLTLQVLPRHEPGYRVYGMWYMEDGTWGSRDDVYSMVYRVCGVECMACGIWYVAYGTWRSRVAISRT